DWIGPAQQEMAEQAALHPDRVVLADWDAASAHVDEWSADGVHPKGNGQGIYARLVRLTVEARLGLR
ncbi:acyltransferase, partial [Corynebacterium diphtheriae]